MFPGVWTADHVPAAESGRDFHQWSCLCGGSFSETMKLLVYSIISNFSNFWTCGRYFRSLMQPFVVGNWLLHSSVHQQHDRSGLKKETGFFFLGQLAAFRCGGNFLHGLKSWEWSLWCCAVYKITEIIHCSPGMGVNTGSWGGQLLLLSVVTEGLIIYTDLKRTLVWVIDFQEVRSIELCKFFNDILLMPCRMIYFLKEYLWVWPWNTLVQANASDVRFYFSWRSKVLKDNNEVV